MGGGCRRRRHLLAGPAPGAPHPQRRLVAVRVRADQRRHPGDRGVGAVPGRDRGRPLHALPARQVGPPGPVVAGAARRCRPLADLDRDQRVQVRLGLSLPAAGPGLDPAQPAPSRRPRRQRRHHRRAAVLHDLLHGLPPAGRDPVHRLLPVHHPARPPGAGVQRRVHRPELPHRQRHGLHAAAAGDVPGCVRRRVPTARPSRAGPAADADAGVDPDHGRGHGLRLLRHPLLLGVRAGARARGRDHHRAAVRVPGPPAGGPCAGARGDGDRRGLLDPGPDAGRDQRRGSGPPGRPSRALRAVAARRLPRCSVAAGEPGQRAPRGRRDRRPRDPG